MVLGPWTLGSRAPESCSDEKGLLSVLPAETQMTASDLLGSSAMSRGSHGNHPNSWEESNLTNNTEKPFSHLLWGL